MAKHSVYDRGASEKGPLMKIRLIIQVLYLHSYINVILKYTGLFSTLNTC